MTHTQAYRLFRLGTASDHSSARTPPPSTLTPRYQLLCHVAPPPVTHTLLPPPLLTPPPPPPPNHFLLMTTALKDLTLKAARHWVVNLKSHPSINQSDAKTQTHANSGIKVERLCTQIRINDIPTQ